MRTARVFLASIIAAATLSAAPAFAATATSAPQLSTHTVAAQGIIMRDGGICDPIRHMGC
jgi:hypothetical protein